MKKQGFTLTELLVVVTIIAILIIITLGSVRGGRDKADDASAKSDLHRLKIAFEGYYADHGCYPPPEYFDDSADCNSENLKPYLNTLPCDQNTGLPYVLETDATGCGWFKLYAKFKAAASDPQALALCDPTGSSLGNYAISSDNVRALILCDEPSSSVASSAPASSPTPTPSYDPSNDYYYCSSGPSSPGQSGNCTNFNPLVDGWCTPYYINNGRCDNGAIYCQTAGSCN